MGNAERTYYLRSNLSHLEECVPPHVDHVGASPAATVQMNPETTDQTLLSLCWLKTVLDPTYGDARMIFPNVVLHQMNKMLATNRRRLNC